MGNCVKGTFAKETKHGIELYSYARRGTAMRRRDCWGGVRKQPARSVARSMPPDTFKSLHHDNVLLTQLASVGLRWSRASETAVGAGCGRNELVQYGGMARQRCMKLVQ